MDNYEQAFNQANISKYRETLLKFVEGKVL